MTTHGIARRRASAVLTTLVLATGAALVAAPATFADGPTTFLNTTAIAIPASSSSDGSGDASAFPSPVSVSGMTGHVAEVKVTFTGLSHSAAGDIDALLVAPDGSNIVLMSDAGSGASTTASNVNLTFDDAVAASLPGGAIASGSYRPTDNASGGADAFGGLGYTLSGATTLASAFAGVTNANGTWKLYVIDDSAGDTGTMAGGWSLTLKTSTAVATTTTLTSSLNPSHAGEEVTFTATVTAGASPADEGTVQFVDNGTNLGSPVLVNASGQASLVTDGLSVGTHSITAEYGGTAELGASTAGTSQEVQLWPTATAVTSGQNPSNPGAFVTFTATVTTGGSPVPTGPVQFYDGISPLGLQVGVAADGTASVTVPLLGTGTHHIRAAYFGTSAYDYSLSPDLAQVVANPASSTTLTSNLNPSLVDDSVTFTATVTSGGSPVITGTVQFYDGATPVGGAVTPDATGAASLTTTSLTEGAHSITATFSGTASIAASTGSLTQLVGKAPTVTALTSSRNPSVVGETVTLSAAITTGGAPLGTGTVLFIDNSTSIVTAVAVAPDGTASLTTATLLPGTHNFVAQYLGTTRYQTSSDTLDQMVATLASVPGGPYTVAEGGTLTLAGSGGPAGSTYEWDLDNDGTFDDATGAGPTLSSPQLEALGLGDGPSAHTVSLRVSFNSASVVATTTVSVTNVAPTTTVDGDLNPTAGEAFTIKIGAEDPSAADMAAMFEYTVDWGDGSPVVVVTGPADPPVTHTYAAAGTYSAVMSATDKDGGAGGALSVTVTAVPAGADPDDDGDLSGTGADTARTVTLAAALLLVGAALVGRRRRA